MNLIRPVTGSLLLVLGLISAAPALGASGSAAIQLWVYVGVYLASAVLVFMGKELGGWGAIVVGTVMLLLFGAQLAQAGGEAEVPAAAWLAVAANLAVVVGGVMLVRSDESATQDD